MDLRKAATLAKQMKMQLTRKEWLVNGTIAFTINPTKSGSVGICIISYSNGDAKIGKLWHPSYEDIVANDWKLVQVTSTQLLSEGIPRIKQRFEPVMVETFDENEFR